MNEQQDELAFFDFLNARGAAIAGAVGQLVTDNVPLDRVRLIAETTTDDIVKLAARIVLHQRGAL